MNKPELLAPAGNLKKLKFALKYGADAVYCGVPGLSLRARINYFDLDSLKEGIEYAHEIDKKVYVTLNIFAHNQHLEIAREHVRDLRKLNPDALIVSDPGILQIIKEEWPEAELHLSTQANCTNWQSAKFWADQGVKRIILGREVTLEEIKEIHEKLPDLELEAFVHGAMCMSYSGRCLISKYYTDRSANLGDCTQPCRWQYKHFVEEVKRPGELLEIDEDMHGSYIMNSRDMCLIEHLKELREAGIISFKVEGRAKSIYYLGNVMKVYREVIDQADEVKDFSKYILELQKTQSRGFIKGFIFGKEQVEQKIDSTHELCEWEFCGEVIGYREGLAKIEVHNQIFVGDEIEIIPPAGENFALKVEKLFNEENNEINEGHGGQDNFIYLPVDKELPVMTLLRRKLKEAK